MRLKDGRGGKSDQCRICLRLHSRHANDRGIEKARRIYFRPPASSDTRRSEKVLSTSYTRMAASAQHGVGKNFCGGQGMKQNYNR